MEILSENGEQRIAELHKRAAILELSYNCSFACPFCYVPWLDHPELYGTPLKTSDWIAVIDNILNNGVEDITLTGGEPLLNPGCKDILRHLARTGKTFCLYTNGEFLDESVFAVLKGTKGRISTSLQGIRHRELLTGSALSFSNWTKRCQDVVAAGIPLQITIPVTKVSLPELERLVRCVARLKPSSIQVGPVLIEGRAKYHPELWLDQRDFKRMENASKKLRSQIRIPILMVAERYCVCRGDARLPENDHPEIAESTDNPKCHELLVIGPDGRIRQCLHTWVPLTAASPNQDGESK